MRAPETRWAQRGRARRALDTRGTAWPRRWKRSTSRSVSRPDAESDHAADPHVQRGAEHRTDARSALLGDATSSIVDSHEHRRHARDRRRAIPPFACSSAPSRRTRSNGTSALQQTGITTEWVLALDADFVLTDAAASEITALSPPPAGRRLSRVIHLLHRRQAATQRGVSAGHRAVPSRARARIEQDGHTQRVQVDGAVTPTCRRRILHDDRKSLSHWLASQVEIHAARSRQAGDGPGIVIGSGRSRPAAGW